MKAGQIKPLSRAPHDKKQLKQIRKEREMQAIKQRVERELALQPKRDRLGKYTEACRELATECGATLDDVLNDFDERASFYLYSDGMNVDVAEARAFEHTRERFLALTERVRRAS